VVAPIGIALERLGVECGQMKGFPMAGIFGGQKILIVDDEVTIADTLALIFASNGYEVRTAYSAEQALEMLDRVCDFFEGELSGRPFLIVFRAAGNGRTARRSQAKGTCL
jgi:hypothetical protein